MRNHLMDFCKCHSIIYVYGANKFQRILYNFLKINNIVPAGYVLSDDRYKDMEGIFRLSQIKKKKFENKKEVGFLISTLESAYNTILTNIMNAGFGIENVYILCQQEKKGITKDVDINRNENKQDKSVSIDLFIKYYTYIENKCKYGNYNLFLHRHLGDSLVLLALKDRFESKYKRPIHYLIQEGQEVLARMYGITNYTIIDIKRMTQDVNTDSYTREQMDAIEENLCERIFTAIPQLDRPFIAAPTCLIQEKCGWKNFVDGWAKMIGISMEKIAVPKHIPILTKETELKIEKMGYKMEEIVLIAPEAQTFTGIPKIFWQRLIDQKLLEGKKVILNSVYENKDFMGTENLDLNISDLIALSYKCSEVHSLRSGLCDCLSAKGDKLHVYYTPDMNFNYFSINKCYDNIGKDVCEQVVSVSEIEYE